MVEIVIFYCTIPYCDLDLEDSKHTFKHDILAQGSREATPLASQSKFKLYKSLVVYILL